MTKKVTLFIISMVFLSMSSFFLGYMWKATAVSKAAMAEKPIIKEFRFDGVSNSSTGQDIYLIRADDLREWLLEHQDREIISISLFQAEPGETRALVVSHYKGRLVFQN